MSKHLFAVVRLIKITEVLFNNFHLTKFIIFYFTSDNIYYVKSNSENHCDDYIQAKFNNFLNK